MRTTQTIVRIPEPCHEDWNKMRPDEKGRFCGSCCKTVVDFTGKTDKEIINILSAQSAGKICGHFKGSQVNRPLQPTVSTPTYTRPPEFLSRVRAFAVAVFMVFGNYLFSFTLQDDGVKQGKVRREVKQGEPVVDRTPVAKEQKVAIQMKGDVKVCEKTFIIDPVDPGLQMGSISAEPVEAVDSVLTIIMGDSILQIADEPTLSIVPLRIFADKTPDSLIAGEIFVLGGIGAGPLILPANILSYTVAEFKEDLPAPVVISDVNSEDIRLTGLFQDEPEDQEPVKEDEQVKTEDQPGNDAPVEEPIDDFFLHIYPNPSVGEFVINYEVKRRTDVSVKIFDMQGRLVENVVDIRQQYEGRYQVPVNASHLPEGVYMASLINEGKHSLKKIVITR